MKQSEFFPSAFKHSKANPNASHSNTAESGLILPGYPILINGLASSVSLYSAARAFPITVFRFSRLRFLGSAASNALSGASGVLAEFDSLRVVFVLETFLRVEDFASLTNCTMAASRSLADNSPFSRILRNEEQTSTELIFREVVPAL